MRIIRRSKVLLIACLAFVPLMATAGSNPPQAAAPFFSLAGGVYNTPQNLVLTDTTPGATIYYTTNGLTPNASSSVYTGPIVIASTKMVAAIAIAPGYSWSVESAKFYNYVPFPIAPAPYFSLAGGTYSTSQKLVLTDSAPGATICYTTNGETPVDDNGFEVGDCKLYTGPITVTSTELVKAAAKAPGYNVSNVSSKKYVYAP
jgi:Chitobiase/beta-hexosaminidase C-terminal domain